MTLTAPSEVVTPTLRATGRRALFWIAVVVFLVIVALITLAVAGTSRTAGTPYSATNPSPVGSKAVAQVLAQQGVTVHITHRLATTENRLRAHPDSTLLLIDPNGYLNEAQLARLGALPAHLVLLAPTFDQLDTLAPQVGNAGTVGDRGLTAGCDLPAATKAGTIGGKGVGYRVVDQEAKVTTCFASGDRVFSLVDIRSDGHDVSVLGAGTVLSNQHIVERGNAALALNLLGDRHDLVWYLPSIADAQVAGAPSIADLTPPWVNPVIALLVLTAIAAAFWRGRRLGPLVVENLPVVVRSSETMEGRARLYQRSSSRLHALDALRIGAVDRLAKTCGLSRFATVEEIIGAVAALTHRDPAGVRRILLTAEPANDRDLVTLSDALLELERATTAATRP